MISLRALLIFLAAVLPATASAQTKTLTGHEAYGDWRADSRGLVRRCTRRGCPGARFVRPLAPTPRDYFVIKAANSAFYCTALELLLDSLADRRMVITVTGCPP